MKADSTVHIVDDRFWSKVWPRSNDTMSDCWVWVGATDRHGYGQVRRGPRPGKLYYTHRACYEHCRGPIPDGLVLDHLCRTPACCNPWHLEPVTQAENVRRGTGNGMREQTHCKRGHAFTSDNTRAQRPDGSGRQCIACKREYDARRYAARKTA